MIIITKDCERGYRLEEMYSEKSAASNESQHVMSA